MWNSGSAFDGEPFRLSDPSLYRIIDAPEDDVVDLGSLYETPETPRRRGRRRGAWKPPQAERGQPTVRHCD